jgi:hypothetical protein
MNQYFILGPDHKPKPVTLMEWARGFGDNRRVAYDKLTNGCVSTVFLGFDHSFSYEQSKDPDTMMMFETMAFDTGTEHDGVPYRCNTYDEALIQHKTIVESV